MRNCRRKPDGHGLPKVAIHIDSKVNNQYVVMCGICPYAISVKGHPTAKQAANYHMNQKHNTKGDYVIIEK